MRNCSRKWITLTIGMALTSFNAGTAGAASSPSELYQVKPGDILWNIAKANNVTVVELKTWNQLQGDMIYAGQSLRIHAAAAEQTVSIAQNAHKTEAEAPNTAAMGHFTVHKVSKGESLFLIAQKYGLSISVLKQDNGLQSDLIYEGQTLNIRTGSQTSFAAVASKQANLSNNDSNNETTASAALPSLSQGSGGTPQEEADVPVFWEDGLFPLAMNTYSSFSDTWGDARKFGGDRHHEGTDILAPLGTPVYSVTDGVVTNYGWSTLGGWRLMIKTANGYSLYYAHLSKYADNVAKGSVVKKGQMIGYVGNTGYGPEGTSGQFVPHLHVGIYDASGAVNPFNSLKYWEIQLKQQNQKW
ncbi:LysM peptidoglycan-binding domain-containing protein [Paenibacillus jiagnxiensis]|uniref:LysM peptidoglycan-binding domain-containing protein n=1 Tax=Paenibacillus jiagnxiensis TaxID=3228926 RepID=UPI0033B8BA5A